MAGLRTEFDFVLPKGYVDPSGNLHRSGTMRLATARDELEPLRDMRVSGPDDPFITIVVMARVITNLGTLGRVSGDDIQGFFAVDLAYLQDFYGIINFGSEAEIAAMLRAQREEVEAEAAEADDEPEADGQERIEVAPAASAPGPAGSRRGRIEEVSASER